jgi:hypothetical protein
MHTAIPPLPLRFLTVVLGTVDIFRRAAVVNLSKQPVLVSMEMTVTAVSVSCTDKGAAKQQRRLPRQHLELNGHSAGHQFP